MFISSLCPDDQTTVYNGVPDIDLNITTPDVNRGDFCRFDVLAKYPSKDNYSITIEIERVQQNANGGESINCLAKTLNRTVTSQLNQHVDFDTDELTTVRCNLNGEYQISAYYLYNNVKIESSKKLFTLNPPYAYPGCISGARKNYLFQYYFMYGSDALQGNEYANLLTTAYDECNVTITKNVNTPGMSSTTLHVPSDQFDVQFLTTWGNLNFDQNLQGNGYLCSIYDIEPITNNDVGGITLGRSNTRENYSFIYCKRINDNPGATDKPLYKILSCIHELGHQMAIVGHFEHDGCCCLTKNWPGRYGSLDCNLSNTNFCEHHKCIIYKSIP